MTRLTNSGTDAAQDSSATHADTTASASIEYQLPAPACLGGDEAFGDQVYGFTADQVQAAFDAGCATLAPVAAQSNPIEYDRIVKADERAIRAVDALDGMGFTYDKEIGWLAPVAAQQAAAECRWPSCLPESEQDKLAQEVMASLNGEVAAKAPAAQAVDAQGMMTLLKDAARAWNNEAESELDTIMERIECFLIDSRAASPASTPEASQQAAAVVNGMQCDRSGLLCGSVNCCPAAITQAAAVAAPSETSANVDWLGLALALEAQANRVESKTAFRAMNAAAHGLRLVGATTQNSSDRFFMDHGVWHDRVTGQHMWTQDQYDEQWRSMYKAGQEDAANGYNMLTGKSISDGAATTSEDAPTDIRLVLDEVERATRKFPTWPTDPLHAVAVLGEEFGELTKAVLQTTYEPHKVKEGELRTEAIQTAAMALRFVASLDRYEFVQCPQHEQPAMRATQQDSAQVAAKGEQA